MGGGCRSVISEAIAAVLCRLAVISGSELLDALKPACTEYEELSVSTAQRSVCIVTFLLRELEGCWGAFELGDTHPSLKSGL